VQVSSLVVTIERAFAQPSPAPFAFLQNLTVEFAHNSSCGGWTAVGSGSPSDFLNSSAPALVSLFAYVTTENGGLRPPSVIEAASSVAVVHRDSNDQDTAQCSWR